MKMKLISHLRISPFAFAVATGIALIMFFISEVAYQRSTSSMRGLDAVSSTGHLVELTRSRLSDAESDARAYMLTGREEFRKAYQGSRQRAAEALAQLAPSNTKSSQKNSASVQNFSRLAAERISEVSELLSLYAKGDEPARRALLMSDLGQSETESLRMSSDSLIGQMMLEVATDRARILRSLMLSRIGIAAMTAMSLLLLLMYLRQASVLMRQRNVQQRLMQRERDRLEHDARHRTQQLTELTQHLQSVRESERNHLAGELHDELGALLTAARLDVARLKARLTPLTPEVEERLQNLGSMLNKGIALKRRIIEDLRPSSLRNLGLVATLQILLREYGQHAEVKVKSSLEPVRLTPSGALTVYRLVQEALTNVTKYAHASLVEVRLWTTPGAVHVSVRDDGVGFDMANQRAHRHGLIGMRYRIEAEGGRMSLTSASGHGTLIEVQLPELRQAPQATARDEVVDAG